MRYLASLLMVKLHRKKREFIFAPDIMHNIVSVYFIYKPFVSDLANACSGLKYAIKFLVLMRAGFTYYGESWLWVA